MMESRNQSHPNLGLLCTYYHMLNPVVHYILTDVVSEKGEKLFRRPRCQVGLRLLPQEGQ